jgi:hypothetical protein
MNLDQFRAQMNRLRKHYGESVYGDELLMILWEEFGTMNEFDMLKIVTECIATRPKSKPPLRDEIRQIAINLGMKQGASTWHYFEIDDCLTCGGCGYYFIAGPGCREAPVACDDCRAGKNLQIAPKGVIRSKVVPQGWAYLRPGKAIRHLELNPRLVARFGDWKGLEAAVLEKRISVTDVMLKRTNL